MSVNRWSTDIGPAMARCVCNITMIIRTEAWQSWMEDFFGGEAEPGHARHWLVLSAPAQDFATIDGEKCREGIDGD
jgi:hypothetical protein